MPELIDADVLRQAAFDYAKRGWPIFPCNPADKRPLVENGLHAATTDAAIIAGWWTTWPHAMIGCRTGPESGIWALDLDFNNGVNGISSFADLAAGRPIPETMETKTPRGGTHLFFAWPANGVVKNSASKLGPGIDTRGEGGYCILPPSQRSDRRFYETLVDVWPDPPEAPPWLLELVMARQHEAVHAVTEKELALLAAKPSTNGSSGAYARAALAAECDRVANAAVGQRNHALNCSAFNLGQLIGAGVLDENQVRARLTDAAAGLAKDDGVDSVAKTIDSGLAAGMQQPRQVPERRQQARSISPPQQQPLSPWCFHADADPQPTAWLIKGVLPELGAGLISGQWGSYKTTVALDLAASVMTAAPFAGKYMVKRGVAYLACEGAGGLASRLTAIARTHGAVGALPFAYRSDCPALTADNALDQLAAIVVDAAKHLKDKFDVALAVVFVDTIVTAAGFRAGDENDAGAAQRVMSVLSGLSQRTGALVLGVDHFGKTIDTGTRGSSAKEGAADVVLALLADREINGAVTNTRLAIRKQREGLAGLELPFTPKTVEVGTDQDGEPITRTVLDWQAAPAEQKQDDKSWAKSLQLLRLILMSALVDGEDVRPFPDGPLVRAVDLKIVRTEFEKQYYADGDDRQRKAARRVAFGRAMKAAQAANLVAVREINGTQMIWLAKPERG